MTTETQPTDQQKHQAAMAAKVAAAGARVVHNGVVEVDGTAPAEPPATETPAAGEQQLVTKAERPAWCPEKFWDAEAGQVRTEALAKSYAEVEAKQSQPKDEKKTATEEKTADDQKQVPPKQVLESAATKAREEYAASGTLSDESYTVLEAAGVSRAQVDLYIAGVKAQETAMKAAVESVTGGDTGWTALESWARANLTQQEQDAANAGLAKMETIKGTVESLWAKYQKAVGSDGKKTTTTTPNATNAVEPFKSRKEMTAAMSDPRYKADRAYREECARRILAAERAGINVWV